MTGFESHKLDEPSVKVNKTPGALFPKLCLIKE